jgi:hypothetical protein
MPKDETVGRSQPGTVGELRRRLAEMGHPWEVQSRLSDDDPLPSPPRGGDASAPAAPEKFASVDDLKDALRAGPPPTNPFLQQEWARAGLMDEGAMHGIAGSPEDPADGQPPGESACDP